MRYISILLFSCLLLALLCADVSIVFAQAPTMPKIVFRSIRNDDSNIYIMNPDGSDVVNLTPNLSRSREPVWSPTGEQILFVSNRDSELDLYLMDADGKNVNPVFENAGTRYSPTWHPNGDRIAYLDYGEWAIYTADKDGRNTKRIAITGKTGGYPDWSPDGSEIAFVVFAENTVKYHIRIINIETGMHRTLKHIPPQISMLDPAWAPEGGRIAYGSLHLLIRQAADQGTIYIMNRDGSDLQEIVRKAGPRASNPTWSPHGDVILYEQKVDGDRQIFKLHLNSRVTMQLTHKGSNSHADWFDPEALSVQPQENLLSTSWGKLKQK